MKCNLIYREVLALGSSNFDFVSFQAEEELLALVRDGELIAQFQQQVLEPLLEASLPPSAWRPGRLAALSSHVLLKAADLAIRALPYRRRSASDWCD
jgi:hypothetical protein